MKIWLAASIVVGATLSSIASAQYKLGGPVGTLTPQSGGWSWDNFELSQFRDALANPNFFGPGGASPHSVVTSNLNDLDAASLSTVNGLVLPWMYDSDTTPAQESAILSFFMNGGDLVLLDDGDYADRIAEDLGLPTSHSDGSPSNGGSPLFSGVFGSAVDVQQNGDYGQLLAADVAGHNGTIGGTNTAGEITAAFWEKGQYAAGAGKLLIVADVDMWSAQTSAYGTTLGDLNDNGRFALNSVDWLVNSNPVPEPATMATLAVGAAALLRRRKKK